MTGAPAMSIGAAPESSGRRARELIALAMGAAFALACWWLTRRATRVSGW